MMVRPRILVPSREPGRIDGPPFRFIPSPEGAHYQEYPRISRHYIFGPLPTVAF